MKKIYELFFVMFILYGGSISLRAQWVQLPQNGLGNVNCFAANGSNLFAGTSNGVYLSTNNGTTWSTVNTGLTFPEVMSLAFIGTNLFAGTVGGGGLGGLFLSTNNGTSWVNTGLTSKWVFSLAVSGSNLFVGCDDRVFHTTSDGNSWTIATTSSGINDARSLAIMDTILFAGTGYMGIFRSRDNCASWTKVKNDGAMDIAVINTSIFIGMSGGMGVYRSTDYGETWTQENNGLTVPNVQTFAVSGGNLFAGTFGNGVYLTTNNADSWIEVNDGIPQYTNVGALNVIETELFAFTDKGIYHRPLTDMVTGVEKESIELPAEFRLEQNYPNPFNPSTVIDYSIPKATFVSLKVFDILGREVETLVNEKKNAENYSINFYGGNLVSGVYIYIMHAGNFVETKKLLLLK